MITIHICITMFCQGFYYFPKLGERLFIIKNMHFAVLYYIKMVFQNVETYRFSLCFQVTRISHYFCVNSVSHFFCHHFTLSSIIIKFIEDIMEGCTRCEPIKNNKTWSLQTFLSYLQWSMNCFCKTHTKKKN